MDDSDILSFGNSRKISFKAALRSVQSNRPKIKASTIVENSSSDSNNSDDDDESRRNRKRIQHKVGGKVGSLASRLIHNQLEPCVISSDSDDSDLESGSKWDYAHQLYSGLMLLVGHKLLLLLLLDLLLFLEQSCYSYGRYENSLLWPTSLAWCIFLPVRLLHALHIHSVINCN